MHVNIYAAFALSTEMQYNYTNAGRQGAMAMGTAGKLAIDGGTPVRTAPLPYGRGAALLGPEERAAALEVLDSRSLFRYYGPNLLRRTEAFEAAVCERLGAAHAVATSSGTAALRTGLAALGVGCGDEVIVPAFTFVATVNAVVVAGAVPVFAEIDESLGLDPADMGAKLTERTAAVVPVHIENVACDMDALLAVARARSIPVLEDAAQSMGATFGGRAVGTLGDLGAFSLQMEKNVTAGEGGVVVTDDEHLYVRAARYQDQGGQFVTSHGGGRGHELDEPFVGENLRMTELAGAIAGVQVGRLPELLAAMGANKGRILDLLGPVDGLQRRRLPDPDGDGGSSITWFTPSAPVAARFVDALRAEGVPSVRMYAGLPVYATPAILERRTASNKGGPWHCAEHPTAVEYRMGMCPRTEDLAARAVTVPVGPRYTDDDCADVAAAIAKVASAVLA
jgi:8-amino-3,8-dideoxy-alpha-D-manno-octulosonate transaminase